MAPRPPPACESGAAGLPAAQPQVQPEPRGFKHISLYLEKKALLHAGTFLCVGFFTAAVWCVPALRVPLVLSLKTTFAKYGSRDHTPTHITTVRPKTASLGVRDLGAISSPLREVEIAPRSPTPRDASSGRSQVNQRAEHAKGIHIASARNRPERPIQARTAPGGAPSPTPPGRSKADFGRLLARCHEAVSGKQSGSTGRSTPIHDAHAWAGAMGTTVQHAKRCQS